MFIRITCQSYGQPFFLNAVLVLTVREVTSDGHDLFEAPVAAVQIDPRYHDRFEEVAVITTNELDSGEIFTTEPFEEVAAQFGVEILRPVDLAGLRMQVEAAIEERNARSVETSSPEIAEIFNVINDGKVRLHVPLHGEARNAPVGTNRKETKMSDMSLEAVYATFDRDWLEDQFCFVAIEQSQNIMSRVTSSKLFETVMGSRLRAVEAGLRKASPCRAFIVSEVSSNFLRFSYGMAEDNRLAAVSSQRHFSPVDYIEIKDEISEKNAYSDAPITTFVNFLNQMDHQAKCNPRLYQSGIDRMMKVEALLRVAQLVPFGLNTPKFEARIA